MDEFEVKTNINREIYPRKIYLIRSSSDDVYNLVEVIGCLNIVDAFLCFINLFSQ